MLEHRCLPRPWKCKADDDMVYYVYLNVYEVLVEGRKIIQNDFHAYPARLALNAEDELLQRSSGV